MRRPAAELLPQESHESHAWGSESGKISPEQAREEMRARVQEIKRSGARDANKNLKIEDVLAEKEFFSKGHGMDKRHAAGMTEDQATEEAQTEVAGFSIEKIRHILAEDYGLKVDERGMPETFWTKLRLTGKRKSDGYANELLLALERRAVEGPMTGPRMSVPRMNTEGGMSRSLNAMRRREKPIEIEEAGASVYHPSRAERNAPKTLGKKEKAKLVKRSKQAKNEAVAEEFMEAGRMPGDEKRAA